jgi:hypothetical protein
MTFCPLCGQNRASAHYVGRIERLPIMWAETSFCPLCHENGPMAIANMASQAFRVATRGMV